MGKCYTQNGGIFLLGLSETESLFSVMFLFKSIYLKF